jgi:hypothetical protein
MMQGVDMKFNPELIAMVKTKLNNKTHFTGKSIPLQAWTEPYGFRRLRFSEFIENWHISVARLSALRTGRL